MAKKCSKCGVTKKLTEFIKDSQKKDGLYPSCKRCNSDRHRKWRMDNKEKTKAYHKVYDKEWAAKNPEKVKARCRRWEQNNPEKAKIRKDRYRAKKMLVDENYGWRDKQYTRDRFCNECFNCNSTDDLQFDHNYPLSEGNALSKTNAVLLCKSCNCSKQDKLPEDFYCKEKLNLLNWLLS